MQDKVPDSTVTPSSKVSHLLPPWTYFSDEFHTLEVESLFKRNWLLVGHTSDLKMAGDYLTFEAFDERVIVVRNENGDLNAFHNVCKHRGGQILDAANTVTGNCRKAMMCPFHGWSYDLDGKLKNVPAANTFSGLDITSIALASVELEIWMGFIFIRFVSEGPSLATLMAPVEHEFRPYMTESMEPLYPATVEEKPYNWKTIHDIDNEGYHVPVGHPSLQQLYGGNYVDSLEHGFLVARATLNDKPGRNWSVRNYQTLLPHFDHLPAERQRLWYYLLLFPNLIFGLYPDMMEIYMTIPDSPTSTRYISRTYALPDSRREARAARYLNVRINTETAEEDDSFVASLQQGMKSSAWQPPNLSSLESGVATYHSFIQGALPVGKLSQEPASGTLRQVNETMCAKS